jgi:translocation and assembly module TamA
VDGKVRAASGTDRIALVSAIDENLFIDRRLTARLLWLALWVAALLYGRGAHAADPQPYAVQFTGTGNAALDAALRGSSQLESLRKSAPAGPFALIARARQDRERLRTVAESFGYYAARIEVEIEGQGLEALDLAQRLTDLAPDHEAAVKVTVAAGELFHLRRIDIDGEVDAAARAHLQLQSGAPAVAQQVLEASGRLLTALQEEGYAFVHIDTPVAEVDATEPVIDVSLKVTPGQRVKVGDVRIMGLQRVHEAAVRRRVQLLRGEQYDPRRIDAVRRELLALGVFSSVTVRFPSPPSADGTTPIEFQVTERAKRAVKLSAAYSTDLGGNVGATWSHRNLFGNAEQLNLSASATNFGGSATKSLGYDTRAELVKPDFLHVDQTLQLSIEGLKQDLSAYDQTAVLTGVQLTRKLSTLWTAGVGMTLQREKITQEGQTLDYTLLALPLRANYDSTGQSNPLEDPRRGWRLALAVAPTESLASPRARFVVVQGAVSTYVDLGSDHAGRSILALRAAAANAVGAGQLSLPPDQRFYGGGSATVRGYRYQSVGPTFPGTTDPEGGTALAAGTVEWRQRIGQNFGLALFADAGKVTATEKPFTGTFSIGIGTGVRYYTAIGPIRLDVAVPTHRPAGGDAFELYIGLGQAF